MKQSLVVLSGLAVAAMLRPGTAFAQEETTATLAVAEARLGTDVQNKDLVGEDSSFVQDSKVYIWMKVTGGPADSIEVTWKHEDHTYATKLRIGGSPWRTWAYKTVAFAGEWTVTVTDATGNVLKEMAFSVKAAPKM